MASKKPNKNTKAYALKEASKYKKKAIALAKTICRSRGYCEYTGQKSPDVQLQASHIFPQEYAATAADPDNMLCLSAAAHKWSKFSWHKSPEIPVWFFVNQPERYERLKKKALEGTTPNWKEKYEELKALESESLT